MQEDESQSDNDDCGSGLSTLTFLNFAMASISIAANLLSNSNSNSNNNNNNNNNNNKNDNNVNIGNSNNNVNSQNVLMFTPMIGRRSVMENSRETATSIFASKDFCQPNDIPIWMKKAVIRALDFFLRLENCSKLSDVQLCKQQEIQFEKIQLDNFSDITQRFVVEHLLVGTAKISGLDF